MPRRYSAKLTADRNHPISITDGISQADQLLALTAGAGWDSSFACPASLAADPVKRIVVVMKDGPAREAPLTAVVFDPLARVAAGRKAAVAAVF